MAQQNDSANRSMRSLLLAWAVLLVILFVAALYWAWDVTFSEVRELSDAQRQMVTERIKPVGRVNTGEVTETAAAAGGGEPRSGEEVYSSVCAACHTTGVLESPKLGDKAAWEPRIAKGEDTLFDHAWNGFNQMPAKGGDSALTEDELKATIAYMLQEVGVESKFADAAAASGVEETASGQETAEGESKAGGETESGGTEGEAEAESQATGESQEQEQAAEGGQQGTAATEDSGGNGGADYQALLDQADPAKGQQVYNQLCMACHMTGATGAPIMGNKEAWAPRLEKDMTTLLQHSIEGFNAMPPKGGNPSLSDQDMASAVVYMVNENK